MTIGEQGVLPAVRNAASHSMVLADGFSCRTQIDQCDTGRRAMHLAEALALSLDGVLPADHPEKSTERPRAPKRDAWMLTAAVAAIACTATGATYGCLRRMSRR